MGNQATVYLFQLNSLLVPADTPESGINQAIEAAGQEAKTKLLNAAGPENADDFSVSASDGSCRIKAIMLNSAEVPGGWKQIPVRQAVSMAADTAMIKDAGETGRILRAFHVAQWRRESRFCGFCGSRNADSETETARICPVCGRLEFPRISPAVITLVVNEKDEILLAHNAKFSAKIYSLIAGFNEAGESLETTVAREIMEEVNINVGDIKYVRSQPWPFPNSLMLGFTARYSGGRIKCDGIEIEDAQWFSRSNLPLLPAGGSVSRYLINLWLEGKFF